MVLSTVYAVTRRLLWLPALLLRRDVCKDAELLPAPILDVRGEERNSNFGEWLLAIFFEFGTGTKIS